MDFSPWIQIQLSPDNAISDRGYNLLNIEIWHPSQGSILFV